MPILKELSHCYDWPWETVAEAVWKRHPNVARFAERKNVAVTEKRIIDVNGKAKVWRQVTYDYSQLANNMLLQGAIGNGTEIKLKEELEFDWGQRELTVVAMHTTPNEEIKYTEKCVFKTNPENNKQTLMRQTGFSLGPLFHFTRLNQPLL